MGQVSTYRKVPVTEKNMKILKGLEETVEGSTSLTHAGS